METENPNELYFYWRGTCATYNIEKKELKLYPDQMLNVAWELYPDEACCFIDWIAECEQHRLGTSESLPESKEYY